MSSQASNQTIISSQRSQELTCSAAERNQSSSAAMLVSRGSSLEMEHAQERTTTGQQLEEKQLAGTSQQPMESEEQTSESLEQQIQLAVHQLQQQHQFHSQLQQQQTDDTQQDIQDPLVARMRHIVEGTQPHQSSATQVTSSDSLNQPNLESRGSTESGGQQKRSRHSRTHCHIHHSHHNHHAHHTHHGHHHHHHHNQHHHHHHHHHQRRQQAHQQPKSLSQSDEREKPIGRIAMEGQEQVGGSSSSSLCSQRKQEEQKITETTNQSGLNQSTVHSHGHHHGHHSHHGHHHHHHHNHQHGHHHHQHGHQCHKKRLALEPSTAKQESEGNSHEAAKEISGSGEISGSPRVPLSEVAANSCRHTCCSRRSSNNQCSSRHRQAQTGNVGGSSSSVSKPVLTSGPTDENQPEQSGDQSIQQLHKHHSHGHHHHHHHHHHHTHQGHNHHLHQHGHHHHHHHHHHHKPNHQNQHGNNRQLNEQAGHQSEHGTRSRHQRRSKADSSAETNEKLSMGSPAIVRVQHHQVGVASPEASECAEEANSEDVVRMEMSPNQTKTESDEPKEAKKLLDGGQEGSNDGRQASTLAIHKATHQSENSASQAHHPTGPSSSSSASGFGPSTSVAQSAAHPQAAQTNQIGETSNLASQKERNSQLVSSNLPAGSTNQPSQMQTHPLVQSVVSPDRRCRLCWCCCCPCSGLSNRGQPSKAGAEAGAKATASSHVASLEKCPSLPNVSLEKIRSWAESFDRLMKCPDGRRIFQDFLRCEYSEENILFWIACEELKNEKDARNVGTKARDIYEDYISILSAKEVSLDSRVRDIINNNIKKPNSNIFDEAQLQIYTLMHRDSYPRFINSPMYKKLAQLQTNNSRKGST